MIHSNAGRARLPLAPVVLAFALSVAACGGNVPTSPPQPSATEAPPSAVASATPSRTAAPTPAPSIAQGSPFPAFVSFSSCTLLPADTVKTLMGAAPATNPTEFEGGPSQQLCTWQTDSSSGKANELDLGVFIRTFEFQVGFQPLPASASPTPVTGDWDAAEYAVVGGATGPGSQVIQASKGQFQISMTIHYGGTLPAPGSTKEVLVGAAKTVLAALEALAPKG